MPLTFVEPTSSPPTLNIVLYGPEGSGKTWGSLSAPGPILYLNAEGRNGVDDAREHYGAAHIHEVTIDSPQVLDEAELYLRGGGEGEQTVVIDSLSSAYRALVDHFSGGGKPSLPNYGDAGLRIERFCRALRDMPFNVIAIAHEIAIRDDATGAFERMPYTGSNNPALGVKIMSDYDVVAYSARVAPEDGSEPRTLAQVIAGNGRRGKNRGGFLPPFLPLDIGTWLELKRATRATRPEHAAAPVKALAPDGAAHRNPTDSAGHAHGAHVAAAGKAAA